MGYEPTNWKTGDVITAEKLNKIENGIEESGEGGNLKVMVVTFSENRETDSLVSDKTYAEVDDFASHCYISGESAAIIGRYGPQVFSFFGTSPAGHAFVRSDASPSSDTDYSVGVSVITLHEDNSVTQVNKTLLTDGGYLTVVPFFVQKTGENEWTPSITGYEMSEYILGAKHLLICTYESEVYYYAGSYDAGVGTRGFKFNNIRVNGDTATISMFKFTNTGGSSFETKSFSANTSA